MDWWHLRCAVRVIRAGGVVAYPTESVFGLGCEPMDEAAVLRILSIKGRAPSKGLIIIGARVAQLETLLAPQSAEILVPLLASRPDPTTWVLRARPEVPDWLTGGRDSIAVRVTSHPLAAGLCDLYGGPLVSTSANRSGRPPARTTLRAHRLVGDVVDYVLPGATSGAPRPSEIRDAESGRLLRSGL